MYSNTPPKTKRSRFISFSGGMQGELHKTLSGAYCQQKLVYGTPTKKHDRMNAMGWLVGRSYRELRLCELSLRMLLIWERLVLDGRPRELCDSPTFLNINQRVLPPQHIVVNPFPDYPIA